MGKELFYYAERAKLCQNVAAIFEKDLFFTLEQSLRKSKRVTREFWGTFSLIEEQISTSDHLD